MMQSKKHSAHSRSPVCFVAGVAGYRLRRCSNSPRRTLASQFFPHTMPRPPINARALAQKARSKEPQGGDGGKCTSVSPGGDGPAPFDQPVVGKHDWFPGRLIENTHAGQYGLLGELAGPLCASCTSLHHRAPTLANALGHHSTGLRRRERRRPMTRRRGCTSPPSKVHRITSQSFRNGSRLAPRGRIVARDVRPRCS